MSEVSQLQLMANYNQVMNQRMITACEKQPNDLLFADKGAFFRSIMGTLNHIMVGDILWLKRFSAHSVAYTSLHPLDSMEQPCGLDSILFEDLPTLKNERSRLDEIIIAFCNELQETDLVQALKYTNSKGAVHNKRLGDLILHLFLHQIHHRGQITTLLSQENIDFGETDLPEFIPDMAM